MEKHGTHIIFPDCKDAILPKVQHSSGLPPLESLPKRHAGGHNSDTLHSRSKPLVLLWNICEDLQRMRDMRESSQGGRISKL